MDRLAAKKSPAKNLWELKPKLRIRSKSLRSRLLALHADLFDIDAKVSKFSAHYPAHITSLEKMVIVLEDRRFFKHFGVDLRSVVRELLRLLTGRRHGGASTIDMQFVRTVTGYKALTLKRKLYECLLATIIQRRYTKIQILRSYLNCAFFGSHLVGADKAAHRIFGEAAKALSDEQAAFIAAMLVCPKPIQPTSEWESRVQRRAQYGYSIYIRSKNRFDQYPT